MKITVFTGNQPRHLALINKLSSIGDEVFAIKECNTVFPGQVPDFYKKSQVMRDYFSHVMAAEKKIFGDVSFSRSKVKTLSIKSGDLNLLNQEQLSEALQSDIYIVFGSSFIKGWLIDTLIAKKAINIHMGISPYYRGSSCNFWALYDGNVKHIGATIHLLSKGLDSGAMLYHAVPKLDQQNPFEFTMGSVETAQNSLIERITDESLMKMPAVNQDKTLEIRYSRNAEFDDNIASDYLLRGLDNQKLCNLYQNAPEPDLLLPFRS